MISFKQTLLNQIKQVPGEIRNTFRRRRQESTVEETRLNAEAAIAGLYKLMNKKEFHLIFDKKIYKNNEFIYSWE
jgi:hypothetical protein